MSLKDAHPALIEVVLTQCREVVGTKKAKCDCTTGECQLEKYAKEVKSWKRPRKRKQKVKVIYFEKPQ